MKSGQIREVSEQLAVIREERLEVSVQLAEIRYEFRFRQGFGGRSKNSEWSYSRCSWIDGLLLSATGFQFRTENFGILNTQY